jgi:hypothetical protein
MYNEKLAFYVIAPPAFGGIARAKPEAIYSLTETADRSGSSV